MITADTPFSVWEAVLYAFLNSFPYMLLVLWSFRRRWRFGKGITAALLLLVTAFQCVATPLRLFSPTVQSPVFDIVFSLIYIAFFFLSIRAPLGMLVFTVLIYMNLGNLTIMCAKCLEGMLLGEKALLRYHFTYSLCMIPVLCVLLPTVYMLIFRDICPDNDDYEPVNSSGKDSAIVMWRWLWLIPAVFFLIWSEHFYTSGKSALENALDPLSTGYLLLIDTGSILIYRIIVKLVALQESSRKLQTENHLLSVRQLQYANLTDRIDEARRARHDLRHHILLLKEIHDNGDLEALDNLISGYPDLRQLEQPMVFCENETANTILLYYANLCNEIGADFEAALSLPQNCFIEKTALSILLGNLLENAYDACRLVQNEGFVRVKGALTQAGSTGRSVLSLQVENSYAIPPHCVNGRFRSTKHSGEGIGIESVRNIVSHYKGTSSFSATNGVFTVSLILYSISEYSYY